MEYKRKFVRRGEERSARDLRIDMIHDTRQGGGEYVARAVHHHAKVAQSIETNTFFFSGRQKTFRNLQLPSLDPGSASCVPDYLTLSSPPRPTAAPAPRSRVSSHAADGSSGRRRV